MFRGNLVLYERAYSVSLCCRCWSRTLHRETGIKQLIQVERLKLSTQLVNYSQRTKKVKVKRKSAVSELLHALDSSRGTAAITDLRRTVVSPVECLLSVEECTVRLR
jgi:hypothetical protein